MVQRPEEGNLTILLSARRSNKLRAVNIPAASNSEYVLKSILPIKELANRCRRYGIDLGAVSETAFRYARFIGLGPQDITMLSATWYDLAHVWVEVEGRMRTLDIQPAAAPLVGLPAVLEKWQARLVTNPDDEHIPPKVTATTWKPFQDFVKSLLVIQKAAELTTDPEAAKLLFTPGMGGIMSIMLGTFWLGKYIVEKGAANLAPGWDHLVGTLSALMQSWLDVHVVARVK